MKHTLSKPKRASRHSDSPTERLRQLARAVEQSPVTVVITDTQGIIEYVNPRFTQTTGYPFDEAIGKNPRILKSGEMAAEEYTRLWATLTAGGEWRGEFHNRKKNGELYWESATISPIKDERGNITHYLAIKEDITEGKRVQAALRESEQYARSIIESSLDMIITIDNQRRITEFNPAAEQVFGYTRAQVLGEHVNLLYADHAEGRAVHQTVLLNGKLVQEIWNKRKNGEIFPAYLSAAIMRNEQGEMLGIVGLSRDITQVKRANEMLARRVAELEALRQASLSLTASLDLPAVLESILDNTMRLMPGAQDSHIYLYVDGQLTFGTSQWHDGRQGEEWASPRQDGLTYTVARSGEAIIVPDFQTHPLYANMTTGWQGAIIGLPLKIADRVVGVMSIAFTEPRDFSEEDLRALRLLADQAAIGIENARLYNQVQQLAITDPLTGCYNRRGFVQLGEVEFNRAWRFNRPLAVLMIDVDHYKQLNDTYGHAIGDQILAAMVDCYRANLRTVDIVGRYGGEEFVVLLPEVDLRTALRVAERLRAAVAAMSVPVNDPGIRVTISVGVAILTRNTPDLDALVKRADQAQYRAKQAGRNQVAVSEE